jgi:hypothetical protein
LSVSRRGVLGACSLALASGVLRTQRVGAASRWAPPVAPVRVGAPVRIVIPQIRVDAPVEEVWLIPANQAAPATDGADHLFAASLDGSQIGLPSGPEAVGWYALGSTPGSPGSALLVGHVDTVTGPAVFSRIPSLRPGSLLQIEVINSAPTTRASSIPPALSGVPATPRVPADPDADSETLQESSTSNQSSTPPTSLATFVVDAGWRHPVQLPPPAELFAVEGPPRLFLVTCTGRFVRSAGGYQERLILAASPVPTDEVAA